MALITSDFAPVSSRLARSVFLMKASTSSALTCLSLTSALSMVSNLFSGEGLVRQCFVLF